MSKTTLVLLITVIQIASPADIRLPVRRNAAVTKTLLSSLSSYICPAGDAMLRSFPQARPLLRRMGFDKRDAYFFKQMGKGMLCTYALLGAAWLWNDTSPLGWRTLKPRPKVLLKQYILVIVYHSTSSPYICHLQHSNMKL
ncbi:uncharacterized protein LOC119281347 isoform X5 [Triticum dicoccoides]|uniref:uncharacterized protein LOC119281347 isoform X5 n=1 Tax=Triticum dicoccoides TaxID=85692 RepID=UPI00188E1149|nr:uncharacterized protein LOC119281347 isoform X5 [Triticum dicoccoides]